MVKELIGLCKKCLGCNKIENPSFKGIYRCDYATEKQISIEEIQKELKSK